MKGYKHEAKSIFFIYKRIPDCLMLKHVKYLQTGNNLKLIFLFFFSESSCGTLGNGLLSKSFAEAFLTGGGGGLSSSPLESMM